MDTSSAVRQSTHLSFALHTFNDLLNKTPKGQNLCYSPFGAQVILTLLHELSTKESRTAIEHAFEYGEEAVAENMRDVHRRRRAYNAGNDIRIASSLWMRGPCKLTRTLETRIREQLGAESFTRDFTPGTVEEINHWAWENTGGHVGSIVDDVSESPVLALNAIYFECEWNEPFEGLHNRREWFTLDDASCVKTAADDS